MKARTGLAAAAVVLSMILSPLGCGKEKAGGEAGGAGAKGSAAKGSAAKAPAHKITPLPWRAEEAPVTVEFLGLTADKESARYRIHVISDKPVTQVDVGFTYIGADGKEQRGTVVWNAVDSKRQPIEKREDHEDQIRVGRGATNVTFKALHVVFNDRTSWGLR